MAEPRGNTMAWATVLAVGGVARAGESGEVRGVGGGLRCRVAGPSGVDGDVTGAAGMSLQALR